MRAALIRRRLVRMRAAVVVIQKYKRMIDCMKSAPAQRGAIHGSETYAALVHSFLRFRLYVVSRVF